MIKANIFKLCIYNNDKCSFYIFIIELKLTIIHKHLYLNLNIYHLFLILLLLFSFFLSYELLLEELSIHVFLQVGVLINAFGLEYKTVVRYLFFFSSFLFNSIFTFFLQ